MRTPNVPHTKSGNKSGKNEQIITSKTWKTSYGTISRKQNPRSCQPIPNSDGKTVPFAKLKKDHTYSQTTSKTNNGRLTTTEIRTHPKIGYTRTAVQAEQPLDMHHIYQWTSSPWKNS